MKVFYYCYAAAHSSVVAAAIHCGQLPADRIPEREEILRLPYYDRTDPGCIGTPYFIGRDEYNHEIYIIGMKGYKDVVLRAIESFLAIHHIPLEQIRFVDVFHLVNLSTKIGGALSKRFGVTGLGRALSIWGIRRQYWHIVRLVMTVKSR